MKATMSQDGELRFTITIKRRVTARDLVDGLGWTFCREGLMSYDEENPARAVETALKAYSSRKAILKAATDAIAADGDSVWVWADDAAAWKDQLREQARVLVAKKFPELKPKPISHAA